MRHNSDRVIKVNKANLIAKVKENKEKHQKEFAEAVTAFKKEAAEQITKAGDALAKGEFKDVNLRLIVPVDKSDEYDKVVQMFEWEVEPEVELSQDEFNEYVFDETDFAVSARLSNVMYTSKWK